MASPNSAKIHQVHDLEELSLLASELKANLKLPTVLLLNGELGVGKTALAKKIANKFGFEESQIKSPSYSLINIYKNSQVQINHLDFYRLNGHDQFLLNELLEISAQPNALTIIEWPERLDLNLLFSNVNQVLQINLSLKNQDKNTFRQVEIHDKSN